MSKTNQHLNIKVISTQHPGNYYIEDTKNLSEKQLKKHLECLKRNKQAKLLDYKIINRRLDK